jgi:hypothetical protein
MRFANPNARSEVMAKVHSRTVGPPLREMRSQPLTRGPLTRPQAETLVLRSAWRPLWLVKNQASWPNSINIMSILWPSHPQLVVLLLGY